jgi:hypothetical protein
MTSTHVCYLGKRSLTRQVLADQNPLALSGRANHVFGQRSIRCPLRSWAAIQRRGSILAWIVILSVYGANTIAEVKLLISPFLR